LRSLVFGFLHQEEAFDHLTLLKRFLEKENHYIGNENLGLDKTPSIAHPVEYSIDLALVKNHNWHQFNIEREYSTAW
jgi:hypothetical protein